MFESVKPRGAGLENWGETLTEPILIKVKSNTNREARGFIFIISKGNTKSLIRSKGRAHQRTTGTGHKLNRGAGASRAQGKAP